MYGLSIIVLVLLLIFPEFTILPSPAIVDIGVEARFECQYIGSFATQWRVNETYMNPLSQLPPGISLTSSSNSTDILKVIAIPNYNGTVVQCVAIVLQDLGQNIVELSPIVSLQIINTNGILY